MIDVLVDNRLRFPFALGPGLPSVECQAEICAAFEHNNPEFYKKQAMGFWVGDTPPTINTWEIVDGVVSLPRGGTAKLRAILFENDIAWKFIDARTDGDPELAGRIPPHNVDLWEHQEESVFAAIEKQNCLIRAPTGSGKTTAGFALASRLNLPTIVIVHSGALFDQWVTRCVVELGMKKSDVGIVRAAKFKLRPITIAMQQTLNKRSEEQWDELERTFGVVICDEVQRFAASTFLATIDRFPARYRVGISADETRKDKKEFLVYDMFGSVAYEVKKEVLEARKLVHDVEVRVVPTDFEAKWYREQIEDPEMNPDFNRLLELMSVDRLRNELIMSIVTSEMGMRSAREPKQVLIFSHRRAHCQNLASIGIEYGFSTGLLLGSKEDEAEFRRTVERLKGGELMLAIGTLQAIGMGLDLPSVSRGIVGTPIAGNRQFWGQVRGRLCRMAPGKIDAVIYYLWDRDVGGLTHLRNLIKWNRTVTVFVDSVWVDGAAHLKKLEQDAKQKRRQA